MKKIIFTSALLINSWAFAQKAEMTFSSAIEVSPRASIRLYDIAEIKNANDNLLSEIKNIEITQDSKSNIYLNKSELIKKLKGLEAQFILPSEIKILKSKSAVSRLEIERKLKNHLSVTCAQCEYSIQINSVPQSINSDWDMNTYIDLSKTIINIPVTDRGQAEVKGYFSVEIKKYAYVPVLNQNVKAGDLIQQEMLSLEKRLLLSNQDTLQNKALVAGLQATRPLLAGQTLTFRDLKKELVLKKGQMVKAIFGQEGLEISITAQAEENGSVGDVIKVKNLDSQKMFAAKIVDRGLVKIE